MWGTRLLKAHNIRQYETRKIWACGNLEVGFGVSVWGKPLARELCAGGWWAEVTAHEAKAGSDRVPTPVIMRARARMARTLLLVQAMMVSIWSNRAPLMKARLHPTGADKEEALRRSPVKRVAADELP